MLTKTTVTGSVEILEDKRMQVREDIVINDDGKELSRIYTRYVLNPGDIVIDKPQFVQDLSVFLWTPEVIADWKAKEELLSQSPLGQ